MMKIYFRTFLVCTFFLTLWVTPGFSQEGSGDEFETIRKEIEDLKKGQSAIQKELQDIKKLVQSPPAAPARPAAPGFREFTLDIEDEPFRGQEKAQVAVVEFTDYQ